VTQLSELGLDGSLNAIPATTIHKPVATKRPSEFGVHAQVPTRRQDAPKEDVGQTTNACFKIYFGFGM